MNPLDLPGPDFLGFYLAVAALLALALRVYRTPRAAPRQADDAEVSDPYELAHLRGGAAACLETTVVALLERRLLVPSKGAVQAGKYALQSARRPLERAVLESAKDAVSLAWLRMAPKVADALAAVGASLEARQLAATAEARNHRWLASACCMLALFILAGAKLSVALGRGKSNVGLLVILGLTLPIAVYFLGRAGHATTAGLRVLDRARARFARLKDGAKELPPQSDGSELALVAGLWGLALLPALAREQLVEVGLVPAPSTSSDGGSSCSSSSCSSGCGGGCGGCS